MDQFLRPLTRLVVVAVVVMSTTSKARLICEDRFRSTIGIEPCLLVDINNCVEVSQQGKPGRSCIVDVQESRHCWEFYNCVVVSTTTATTATTTHTTSTTTDSPTTTNAPPPTTHDIGIVVGALLVVLVLAVGVVLWWTGHLVVGVGLFQNVYERLWGNDGYV